MKKAIQMLTNGRRRWLAVPLLVFSMAAHADLVLEDEDAAAWRSIEAPAAPAVQPASTASASRLADMAIQSTRLPTTIETRLWQFVATVRAQQQSRPLELLETRLKIVEAASGDVSPVPLPGAAWFLVMGLLGMAGVRFGGGRREATAL